MSRNLNKAIDQVINQVNNLTDKQLSTIDLDYLKCKRRGKNLFILGIFDIVFMSKLRETYSPLQSIHYPNRVFKAVGVIVIDLQSNTYLHHKLYCFPINLDLYDRFRSTNREYDELLEKFLDNPLRIETMTDFTFSSSKFNASRPNSHQSNNYYDVSGKLKTVIDFDIDIYVDKTEDADNGYIHFEDNFFRRVPLTKDSIIENIECTCYENEKDVPYSCNCNDKDNCNNYHIKKCQCGKFTYFRPMTCLKCYLQYGKSKRNIDNAFRGNGRLKDDYDNRITHHSVSAIIPYFHYNADSGGICLGNGSDRITSSLAKEINPIKVILSFKANLGYTDAGETTSYYRQYKSRLTGDNFYKYDEYLTYLNMIQRVTSDKTLPIHIFSIYCYCPQCLFYKIVLSKLDKKINTRGFEVNEGYLVSRDKFIEMYKSYLESTRSRSYIKTDIHIDIKKMVNTPPIDLLVIE